VTSFISVHCR